MHEELDVPGFGSAFGGHATEEGDEQNHNTVILGKLEPISLDL